LLGEDVGSIVGAAIVGTVALKSINVVSDAASGTFGRKRKSARKSSRRKVARWL